MVLDVYEGSKTKDMTHQRLSKLGTTVAFTADMIVTMKKEQAAISFNLEVKNCRKPTVTPCPRGC